MPKVIRNQTIFEIESSELKIIVGEATPGLDCRVKIDPEYEGCATEIFFHSRDIAEKVAAYLAGCLADDGWYV